MVFAQKELRIAAGPKTHENHCFRIGNVAMGLAALVPDAFREWATDYRVSGLRVASQGPEEFARKSAATAVPLISHRELAYLTI
jgi:hypothetical protein